MEENNNLMGLNEDNNSLLDSNEESNILLGESEVINSPIESVGQNNNAFSEKINEETANISLESSEQNIFTNTVSEPEVKEEKVEVKEKKKNNKGIIIVLILIIIGLTGYIVYDNFFADTKCNVADTEDKETTNKDEVVDDSADQTQNTENNSTQVQAKQLSQDELNTFITYFNKKEINGFVTQKYSTTKDIDINQIIYNGLKENKEVISDAEAVAFAKEIKWENPVTSSADLPVGVIKVTKKEVVDHMKKYANVDDISKISWTYLKDYDAYYSMHGDANFIEVKSCSSGKVDENGNYIMTCSLSDNSVFEVTMKKQNDIYVFVSNK